MSAQAFNGLTIIDSLVQTYTNRFCQDGFVISGNYAYNYLQILPVITFLPSLQVLKP